MRLLEDFIFHYRSRYNCDAHFFARQIPAEPIKIYNPSSYLVFCSQTGIPLPGLYHGAAYLTWQKIGIPSASFEGGARWGFVNWFGMVCTITISPPQHLQTPGFMPIRSKAISCHGFLLVAGGRAAFKRALIIASDFLFDAFERKP